MFHSNAFGVRWLSKLGAPFFASATLVAFAVVGYKLLRIRHTEEPSVVSSDRRRPRDIVDGLNVFGAATTDDPPSPDVRNRRRNGSGDNESSGATGENQFDVQYVTQSEAYTLVGMIEDNEQSPEKQCRILKTMANMSAFTRNQNLLREVGAIPAILKLVRSETETVQQAAILALNNLAMNTENQSHIALSIPDVLNLITADGSDISESTLTAGLQLLMNLSVTEEWHQYYIATIPHLFKYITSAVKPIQLNSLKVLVNLSCNKSLIDDFMSCKAPVNLKNLFEFYIDVNVLVRVTTLFSHLVQDLYKHNVNYSKSLTASGDGVKTLYEMLCSAEIDLYSKILKLTKHPNEDVRHFSGKILIGLTQTGH